MTSKPSPGRSPEKLQRLIRRALPLCSSSTSNFGQLLSVPALPSYLKIFLREGDAFMRDRPTVNSDSFVLLTALAGHAEVVLDGLELRVGPGDMLLIFPGEKHRYQNPRGNIRWLFLNIRIAGMEDWLVLKRNVQPLRDPALGMLELCLDNHRRDALDPAQSVRVWLLLDTLRKWAVESGAAGGSGAGNERDGGRMVETALRHMITNLRHPISVREIAGAAGVSPSVLQAQFKKTHHQSVGRLLRTLRVNMAARLLRGSDTPLKVIASECGFSSPSTFSRTFRQSTGFSPANYRAHAAADDAASAAPTSRRQIAK